MAHLYKFRKGWQSEHLARFILSKFSFIAQPSTIADDLGSDFFCTLFKISKIKRSDFLIPQNSFAIQIKSKKEMSNSNNIDITKKVNYLVNLDIPFFVGVVDRENLKMEIFSGEAIDHYITLTGDIPSDKESKRVFIKLKENREINFFDEEKIEGGKSKYFLKFPKILEIFTNFEYTESPKDLEALFETCRLIQGNIYSRKNKEYIFKRYGSDEVVIYTGPGSDKTFRKNFFDRFTEVFCNLEWNYKNQQMELEEFNVYRKIFLSLAQYYERLPSLLTSSFLRLEGKIPRDLKK